MSKLYVVDRRMDVEVYLGLGDPSVEGRIILNMNPHRNIMG